MLFARLKCGCLITIPESERKQSCFEIVVTAHTSMNLADYFDQLPPAADVMYQKVFLQRISTDLFEQKSAHLGDKLQPHAFLNLVACSSAELGFTDNQIQMINEACDFFSNRPYGEVPQCWLQRPDWVKGHQ